MDATLIKEKIENLHTSCLSVRRNVSPGNLSARISLSRMSQPAPRGTCSRLKQEPGEDTGKPSPPHRVPLSGITTTSIPRAHALRKSLPLVSFCQPRVTQRLKWKQNQVQHSNRHVWAHSRRRGSGVLKEKPGALHQSVEMASPQRLMMREAPVEAERPLAG